MGETMRRWILLAYLVFAGAWGGWTMLQRHKEAVWSESYAQASAAFARHDYAGTEKILVSIVPEFREAAKGGNKKRASRVAPALACRKAPQIKSKDPH